MGRPAAASSTESSSYPASNAFDGNPVTRWSSQWSDPQWIYVDLGCASNVNEVKLNWETAYAKAYQIQVSKNAAKWTTIYATTTGMGGVNDLTGLRGSGRYVRMYGTVRGTQWGYSLWEMSVYGRRSACSSPTPRPSPAPQRSWTAPSSPPLSDAAAAALVTHQPEVRPNNAAANNYVPSHSQLSAFRNAKDSSGGTPSQYNPLDRYVDGRDGLSNPSTDDLIQWAAHKWGIPEDWIRAEMVTESNWNQSAVGDATRVSSDCYSQYPSFAQLGNNTVYQSLGLAQVRWSPNACGGIGTGTEPLRWKSTAFNLDSYAAQVRYYYDGICNWCGPGYSAGQQWKSIGAWFNPSPWNNSGARAYVQSVQQHLADRTWPLVGTLLKSAPRRR